MEMQNASKVGFWAALLTALLTLIMFTMAVLTAPLSGPYCTSGCFTYPFDGIVSRFPRDYLWMYPAILLALVYYVLMTSIHHVAPGDRKIFSHIGLSFALIAAATLATDYFVQVSVVQPSLLQGETDGIALISQFNGHGIFIVLEEFGYFMMSLSMLFMAPVFIGQTRTEKAIRWLFVSCFALNTVAFAAYSLAYGIRREYRFEVITILINSLVLIATSILLSGVFRRLMDGSSVVRSTHPAAQS